MLLAVDQGTSSTKAILVDISGAIVARGVAPVGLSTPQHGWVEQSAEEIWGSVQAAVAQCLGDHDPGAVVGLGLSTQRESLVLWERDGGAPLGPLLSWQDQRTAQECEALRASGAGELVAAVSGLPLDPMFSAMKARWLLDRYDPSRTRSRRGELCLGTVDSWLLSRFGGEHVIEAGNASRTQLLDVRTLRWDAQLLELFDVPEAVLPRVVPSSGPFPRARGLAPLADGTHVLGVLGDSHAALFAHAGWRPGCVKATYGTGSSIMSTADPESAGDGLCLTVAWQTEWPVHALEGNIRSTGATLIWLGQVLGYTPDELAELAASSSDGVHLVPAFGGLGAPWWDDSAVGLLSGLSFGTGLPQIARAALESIAFQVEDVVAALERASGPVNTLLVDGGPTSNRALMQLQADTSGRRVARAAARDLSALGAAHLAGRGAGVWDDEALERLDRDREHYEPNEDDGSRERRRAGWLDAVRRARGAGAGTGAPALSLDT
jgi:glycerol kinase